MVVSKNDERRKHSRVGSTTAIKIQLDAGEKRIDLQGSSKDLSLKGLFINSDDTLTAGTKCAIKIYLTGAIKEIKLQIDGTVVRKSESGMGIEFDSMDVDSYTHLKNIVQYNSIDE
jgi:hypothetical protein